MKKAILLTQSFGGSTIKNRPAAYQKNEPEVYEPEPLYPTGVVIIPRNYADEENENFLFPTSVDTDYKIPTVTDDSPLYPSECCD